ncbi:hypothetical protein K504DRAFT_369229 [Pleomassaria siparia CBS 279.74]|uniref:Zn(2)-C6 fungal-type domain-containing protein n=1 Tax=Pleomassaria siparia CBS 279.74 TaxID=1314801 RepID=A0A6G1KN60_9PLEO|nr:hypothetical protein K504DRAFT_369229 [Pleomassaria siparia CBS 279.74]
MSSADPGPSSGPGDVSPTGSGTATNPKMRKRTKTGCLTCRKRRIKCGEERPTCGNCIKSKRQCEGYNQRLVFKNPIGDWPNHPGVVSELPYHSSMLPGTRNPVYRNGPSTQPQESALTSIRPRPLTNYDFSHVQTGPVPGLDPINTQVVARGPRPYPQDLNYQQSLSHSPLHQQPLHSPHHQLPTPTSATSFFSQPSPIHAKFPLQYTHDANMNTYEPRYPHNHHYQQAPVSYDAHVDHKPAGPHPPQEHAMYQQHQRVPHTPDAQNSYQQQSIPVHADDYPQYPDQIPPMNRYTSHSQFQNQQPRAATHVDMSQGASYVLPPAIPHADFSHAKFHPVGSDVKYVPQHAVLGMSPVSHITQQNAPQLQLSGFGGDDHVSPTQVLDEAAIEYQDDDYYDIQSDEDNDDYMLDRDNGDHEDTVALSRDYSLIRHIQTTGELAVRSYDAFIYHGMLSHYVPENVANPLKNPKTARIFAHFIHVTGPSLSIYERNPRNPTSIFHGPTPPALQSLWTDILPLKALNHQGLLHAMLALASLHIARLQGASITPSYKHYAYALKRLGRSLGNPKKRLTIQTLATSLLLAFYEVMTAEHVKWSTHLVGAAHLLAELDLRSLTQEARHLKAEQTTRENPDTIIHQNPDMIIHQRQSGQTIRKSAMMPDEAMVGTIVGKKVDYDDFGGVLEEEEGNTKQQERRRTSGKVDLRSFETLQDLYWWYARHDAFQSIVSGNPLIMAYRHWSDCPPRAPLGRGDALYGSHDHIILLVGRIADFTVRDRERKLRQVEAHGGQWRPTPGMPGTGGMGGPSMGPPSPHVQRTGPPPAMPNFYGMAPTRPPIPLPASYANPNFVPHQHSPPMPNEPHPEPSNLPAAYEAALADWNSISQAHATVARFLANTESFAPLPPDLYPPSLHGNMTPFGPALMHRSYSVSVLWTLLHLSNILLLRSHPAMPPAAMVAASVCAPATQPYAMLIGRICAGMHIPTSDATALTPSLGATLIESTMSLFFAGIQYQDPVQRDWLITRLLEIDRRTGWASAGVIARGCETSWERAADLGRGPPYDRRRTRRLGEQGPVILDDPSSATTDAKWTNGRARGEKEWSKERDTWEKDGEERRFVVNYRTSMVPWAMNLLATDEDLRVGMERVGLGGEINVAGTTRERGG